MLHARAILKLLYDGIQLLKQIAVHTGSVVLAYLKTDSITLTALSI